MSKTTSLKTKIQCAVAATITTSLFVCGSTFAQEQLMPGHMPPQIQIVTQEVQKSTPSQIAIPILPKKEKPIVEIDHQAAHVLSIYVNPSPSSSVGYFIW